MAARAKATSKRRKTPTKAKVTKKGMPRPGSSKKEDVTSAIETVTPEMALEWLTARPTNRPLAKTRVMRYARDMMEKRWRVNGQGIVFDENGGLLDGQHRLEAVIESESPLRTLVVRGVPRNAWASIDQGRARTSANVLAVRGEVNTNVLGAVISRMKFLAMGWPTTKRSSHFPTNEEALTILEHHPKIRDSVNFISASSVKGQTKIMGPMSNFALVHYVASNTHSREQADAFILGVFKGEGLKAGDPRLTLRNKLILTVESGTSHRRWSADPDKHLAYLIKAWNGWVEGRKLERLVYTKRERGMPAFSDIEEMVL